LGILERNYEGDILLTLYCLS